MTSLWMWVAAVVCVTLPRGWCTKKDVLAEYQPTGPLMCQTKCELNSNCDHFEFDSNSLRCLLYKKTRSKLRGNKNSRSDSNQMKTKHTQGPIRPALVKLPKSLQELVNECHEQKCEEYSQCLADRNHHLRCVKPAPIGLEDGTFNCGLCTSPGQQKPDYRTCRCQLGCSKKVRGQKATCHRKCDVYGNTFTMTPNVGISEHNTQITFTWDKSCQQQCIEAKSFNCLSYELPAPSGELRKNCYLQNVSWYDVREKDRLTNDPGWKYYHRNCA